MQIFIIVISSARAERIHGHWSSARVEVATIAPTHDRSGTEREPHHEVGMHLRGAFPVVRRNARITTFSGGLRAHDANFTAPTQIARRSLRNGIAGTTSHVMPRMHFHGYGSPGTLSARNTLPLA